MTESNGTIVGLALKRAHGTPMEVVEQAEATEDGLVGNVHQRRERRITLLSREQWEATQAELGGGLPWTTRRANVLVEGLDLGPLIGKNLRVGEVEIHLYGETHPCSQMEDAQPGLLKAMTPECRGGVYGNVLQGGALRIGDTVTVLGGSE